MNLLVNSMSFFHHGVRRALSDRSRALRGNALVSLSTELRDWRAVVAGGESNGLLLRIGCRYGGDRGRCAGGGNSEVLDVLDAQSSGVVAVDFSGQSGDWKSWTSVIGRQLPQFPAGNRQEATNVTKGIAMNRPKGRY